MTIELEGSVGRVKRNANHFRSIAGTGEDNDICIRFYFEQNTIINYVRIIDITNA